MGNSKNCYGFDHCASPFRQLLELLHIGYDTEGSKQLKKNLERIVSKHFDIKEMPSSQKDAQKRAENELKQRYPEVYGGVDFESEKRIYFALRVMMSFQNHFRKAVKEGRRSARTTLHDAETKGKSSMKPKTIVIDLTSLDDSDNEEMPNSRAPVASTSQLNPTALEAKPEESKVELQQVIARRNTLNSATTTRTSPSSSSRSSRPLAQRATRTSHQTRHSQRHTTPQAGPSSVPQTFDPRIIPIRNFLQACRPSMVHHLNKFQEYGCCSQEHLQNMSEWPQEKRYKELQVLLAIGDVPVVQMDIAMLDGALERYKNRQL